LPCAKKAFSKTMALLRGAVLAGWLAVSMNASLVSDLKDTAALYQQGLLTTAEYELAKHRIFADAPAAPSAAQQAPSPAAAPPPPPGEPQLRTFGTGASALAVNATELTLFEHAVSAGTVGVMTHFWITGMELRPPSLGPTMFRSNGTDNVTVRYYIDGESIASIEFKPPMAAGVGFNDDAANGDPTGMASAKIGRAGMGGD
jgi:hypothetical protein